MKPIESNEESLPKAGAAVSGGAVSRGAVGTGIAGLDSLLGGGLPRRRTTLIAGAPGTGKSIFAFQFLLDGALHHDEPAVYVTFEEGAEEFLANMSTFAWDLGAVVPDRLMVIDGRPEAATFYAGDFDLEGLLAGLGHQVERIGAQRVVFDGLDQLLAQLGDLRRERRELYRLYEWLQRRKLTGVLTGKEGEAATETSLRLSSLEFLADAVFRLEDEVTHGISDRRLRVLKVRGADHSTDVHSFLIGSDGIEVLGRGEPFLDYPAETERISTGVDDLDEMLGGGWFRASSALFSGSPGTAKTTLAASFVDAACRRGEKAAFVSFDESPSAIVRNLRSAGVDLEPHRERGLLEIHGLAARRGSPNRRVHQVQKILQDHEPRCLAIDPISALGEADEKPEADDALLRLVHYAKGRGITTVFTSLLESAMPEREDTASGISTLADTWVHLGYQVQAGERNRSLTIIKSRGTAHSNQVRELILSSDGARLRPVYASGGAVLMGTLRWEREEQERREREARRRERERELFEAETALADVEGRIETLQKTLDLRRRELRRMRASYEEIETDLEAQRRGTERMRTGTSSGPGASDGEEAAEDSGHG